MTATLDYVRQLAAQTAIVSARTAKQSKTKEWWQVGPYRHRGVAYYDKQRLAKQLPPMPAGEYAAPPSWCELPATWGEWSETRANYFHSSASYAATSAATTETSGPIIDATDYTLAATEPGTGFGYYVPRNKSRPKDGEGDWHFQSLPWQLTFADGSDFYFVSRSIAEAALTELLKIRKAKLRRTAASGPYFTSTRLRKLPADAQPCEAADDTELESGEGTELEA